MNTTTVKFSFSKIEGNVYCWQFDTKETPCSMDSLCCYSPLQQIQNQSLVEFHHYTATVLETVKLY